MLKYLQQNWLDYHYWTITNPVVWSKWFGITLLAILGVLVVLGIVAGLIAERLKKSGDHLTAQAWRRGQKIALATGILSLLLVWFRYQQVTLLSSRWWWILIGLWFIWKVVMLVLFIVRKLPKDKAALNKKMAFEKYLP